MLFRWWDRIRDWVILVALLLASVAMVVTRNDPVVNNLRTFSLEVTSYVEAKLTWAGQFLRAVNENAALRRENVDLNSQLARMQLTRQENAQLWRALAFKENSGYEMVGARIISKDIFGQNNFLTLNAGTNDGIAVDMAVVNERGVLGRVVLVSENYCRVLSYLNTGFRVPVEVPPSFAVGMIGWNGVRTDVLNLENVVITETVSMGDTVVTSATSQIFPPGLPVGIVTDVKRIQGLNALEIQVRPAAPIVQTHHAFVLLHRFEEERAQLETREVR